MSRLKGLTLVELLVVVLILGALSAIAIPRLSTSAATAKNRACAANIERINKQIELFNYDTGAWPTALSDVIDNVSYFGGDEVLCPYDLPYVLDNSRFRVIIHDHAGTPWSGTGQNATGSGGNGSGTAGGDGSTGGGGRGRGWAWGRGKGGGWLWGWGRGQGKGLVNRPDHPGQDNQDQGQGNTGNQGQGPK